MNGLSPQSWSSALAVGQEWFPYVGAVLLLLLAVAAVVLIIYLLVLLIKRIPSFFRYIWTSVGRFIKARHSGSVQAREPMKARSGTTQHTVDMDAETGWIARARWRPPRRPDQPLWVLLGSDSPFQLALLQGTGNTSPAKDGSLEQLAWWNFRQCQVVAAPPVFWPRETHDRASQLMRSLSRMAPERPVEGIVVTIEVEQVRLYARQKVGDLANLIEVVASLCEASSFRLPVYVVVTDSQELRGFAEAAALCGKQREAELRFTARMFTGGGQLDLNVAFRNWLSGISPKLWVELCRAEPTIGPLERAELLHLPEQLAGLCESLLVWLAALKTRTEQSPNAPIFESIVFSGASSQADEFTSGTDAAGSIQPMPHPTSLLLPGLQGLSFARPGRAQPTASALQRQQGRTRMAWAVTAVVVLIVGWSVPRAARNLYADVGVIRQAGHSWDGGAVNRERVDTGRLPPRVVGNLIHDIYQVDLASRRRVLVPLSWGDEERERTLSTLGRQLDVRAVRPRVDDLLQREPPLAPKIGMAATRGISVASADQLPASDGLNAYLLSAEAVGGSLQQAEKLPTGVTYGELLKFLEVPLTALPQEMDADRAMPREVTGAFFAVSQAGNDATRLDVQRAMDLYWERLITEAIDQAPLVVDADTVASLATRWSRGQPISADAVRQMSSSLQRLVSEMDNQGARQIAGRPEEFAAYMAKVSARLTRSAVVPMEQAAELTARASKRREQARRRLLQYEATGVGHLFVVGEQERLVLAPTIKPLRDSIAALQSQAFMQVIPASDPAPAPKWSQERLMPARLALQSAEEFSRSAAQSFDPRWVPSLLRLAGSQARMALAMTFEQAMRVASVAQPYAANSSLVDSSEATALVQAVQLFRQGVPLDTEDSREQEIRARLVGDLTAVLTNIERQFRQENSYSRLNADVIRWLKTAAPGVALGGALKMDPVDRLALAREDLRARQLLRAEPILAAMRALTGGAGVGDVWTAWAATQASVADYDKGSANNVLADYEQFVDRIGQLKSADDCSALVGERIGRARGVGHLNRDMFTFRQQFGTACQERATEASRQSYAAFATWFNERVSGRAPFGTSRTDETLTRRQAQQVLQRFRSAKPGWIRADLLRDEDAAQFVTRMEALAMRLIGPERQDLRAGSPGVAPGGAALNASESGPDPVVRARLRLRTNPKEAVLSDQIIDAAVLIDGRRLGLNSKDLLEWRPGESIDVVVRWALSSAYTPVAAVGANADGYLVEGRTATFRFRGDWTLFQLISRYRYPTDSADEMLLRLPIPLIGPDRRTQTGMFFMSLAAPVAGDPLGLDVPESAPALPDSARQRVTSGEEDFLRPLGDSTAAPGSGARRER